MVSPDCMRARQLSARIAYCEVVESMIFPRGPGSPPEDARGNTPAEFVARIGHPRRTHRDGNHDRTCDGSRCKPRAALNIECRWGLLAVGPNQGKHSASQLHRMISGCLKRGSAAREPTLTTNTGSRRCRQKAVERPSGDPPSAGSLFLAKSHKLPVKISHR